MNDKETAVLKAAYAHAAALKAVRASSTRETRGIYQQTLADLVGAAIALEDLPMLDPQQVTKIKRH